MLHVRVHKNVGNRLVYRGNRCYWSGLVAKPVGFASLTEIKKILISVNRSGSRLIVQFLGLGEPDRFWFCEIRWRASIDLLVYMASD
jgi:hypothetical protein